MNAPPSFLGWKLKFGFYTELLTNLETMGIVGVTVVIKARLSVARVVRGCTRVELATLVEVQTHWQLTELLVRALFSHILSIHFDLRQQT